MKILVAGGAGFIGSNFVRYALRRWPDASVHILDKLTYASSRATLAELLSHERVSFTQGDICVPSDVRLAGERCTHVVNFAAETHVDRSLLAAGDFLRSNVDGVGVILEMLRHTEVERFLQVSTDEVYGPVPAGCSASEDDRLSPRNPYAASKAAADLLVLAYHSSFELPVLITRATNTYGPYQYPEKLLPLTVTNALEGTSVPVYGDGMQTRDWLHVEDHCAGVAIALERGKTGQIYNLAANQERSNLEIVRAVLHLLGADASLIRHVEDRPGHDRRYALTIDKIHELGWSPHIALDQGLKDSVSWYRAHQAWWKPLKDAEFQQYYERQYGTRLAGS